MIRAAFRRVVAGVKLLRMMIRQGSPWQVCLAVFYVCVLKGEPIPSEIQIPADLELAFRGEKKA